MIDKTTVTITYYGGGLYQVRTAHQRNAVINWVPESAVTTEIESQLKQVGLPSTHKKDKDSK